MKRSFYLLVLMALSSSAHASEAFSFVVGGHRIRIEAPRHCRSASCVSVSIPGIYETRRNRDRDDDGDSDAPARAPAPAAEPVLPRPIVPPARPCIETVAPAPPAVVAQAEPATAPTPAPPPSIAPPAAPPPAPPPAIAATPAAGIPAAAPGPASEIVSQAAEASHAPDETPVGDWQSEGNKGLVRIEPCGAALCGYVLNRSPDTKGEAVLINMKPKAASGWSGNIYSLASGDTYYATMAMQGPNSLKVEACALGRFFCSGNVWSRIDAKPADLISARQVSSKPRS